MLLPMGTWSDDSSLLLCLADSLCDGYSLVDIAKKFIQWIDGEVWNAHDYVFDIGSTTHESIRNLEQLLSSGEEKKLTERKFYENIHVNGNGSLMRILPLLFFISGKPLLDQWEIVQDVSSLTHPHIIANVGCMIYILFLEGILEGLDKHEAYAAMQKKIKKLPIDDYVLQEYEAIIEKPILKKKASNLYSTGYVVCTLEVCLWVFLTTDYYEDAVKGAISFGGDTDTAACITGGLAGLYYGFSSIPKDWIDVVVKKNDIEEVIIKMQKAFPRFAT